MNKAQSAVLLCQKSMRFQKTLTILDQEFLYKSVWHSSLIFIADTGLRKIVRLIYRSVTGSKHLCPRRARLNVTRIVMGGL
jgi:hypothetical protein